MSENFRPNVCGKYALQGSSRALYNPLDPTHNECTWPVPFQNVGYAVLLGSWRVKDGGLWSGGVIWSELVVWFDSGGLFWWSDLVVGSDDGLLWYSEVVVWAGVRFDGIVSWLSVEVCL